MQTPRGRSVLVIGTWLLLLAVCAAIVATSRLSTDLSAFMPRNPGEQERLLIDQIRHGALSRMVLAGIEGGTAEQRGEASRALARALREGGLFTTVVNGDETDTARDQAWLMQHRYLLGNQVSAARFSTAGLHDAIADSIDALAGSAGMLLKLVFPRDPTGELPALLARIIPPRSPASAGGVWSSPTGELALLVAMTTAPGTDTDAQERALDQARAAFDALPCCAGLRLLMSGAPVFAVDARQTIRRDVQRLSSAGGLALVLVMLAFYRSARNIVIGLLPVATAVIVAMAAIAAGFGIVHAVTIGFGTALMGEALDYSSYYLVQATAGDDWRRQWWPTIRLGVATSVCGYAALLFSSFPGLMQLGLYSMAGLVAAAGTTRFVLPLLPRAPVPASTLDRVGRLMLGMCRGMRRLRWPLVLLALIAAAVVWQHRDTLWARGLEGLDPAPATLQALDARLRASAAVDEPRHVVAVSGPTIDAALEAAEHAEAALAPALARGEVLRITSPAHLLPSAATRAARRAALPDAETLRGRLATAVAGLPVQAARLEPFVQDVQQARDGPDIGIDDLRGSSLGLMLETLLVPREAGGWSAFLELELPAAGTTAPLHATIDATLAAAGLPAARMLDLQRQPLEMFGRYLDEALTWTGTGAVLVLVLLWAVLRRPARVLRVVLPLAGAVALVVAGHVLARTPLTLLHLVGLLLIVAVGSNYALFFARDAEADAPAANAATLASLSSLALANGSTLIGFGILAFSGVPVLRAIGTTVGPGALLALLLAMSWSARPPPRG